MKLKQYEDYFFKSPVYFLLVIFSQLGAFAFLLVFIWMTHSYVMMSLFGFILVSIVKIKIYFQQQMVAQLCRPPLTWSRINLLLTGNTQTLLLFLRINKDICRMFALFLTINCPISSILMYEGFLGSSNYYFRQLITIIVIEHILSIFFVHYQFAQCNRTFSNSFHKILVLVPQNNRLVKPVNNLKISLKIQTFHTKNHYGFTYGKVGLVSFLTFTKVIHIVYHWQT